MVTVLKAARPTARKAHACNLCGSRIEPGETYDRQANVYDGRVYDWLTCLPCLPVFSATWDWCSTGDEGCGMDCADEWATEHRDDPERGEMARAYLTRRGLDIEEAPDAR